MPISRIGTDGIDQTSSQQIGGISVGRGAGAVSTNTAVGASALASTSSGFQNTVVGANAAQFQTNNNNTAIGYNSMVGVTGSSSGGSNTAVGSNSLAGLLTGNFNVAVGQQALVSNTTASYNTAVGYQAGYTNSTGAASTFSGYFSGYNTTGGENTFYGASSGYLVTTGTKNTILGRYSGNQGGLDIRTASNYIVLSDGDGNPRGFFDSNGNFYVPTQSAFFGTTSAIQSTRYSFYSGSGRVIGIEDASGGSGTQVIRFVSAGNNCGTISTTTTSTSYNTSSDYRLKENVAPMTGALSVVQQLKPCTYTWKSNGSSGQGFIAHELAEVVPQCVTGEKDAVDEEGNPDYQAIDTSFLVATLTAAIQELKAEFDAYKEAHP